MKGNVRKSTKRWVPVYGWEDEPFWIRPHTTVNAQEHIEKGVHIGVDFRCDALLRNEDNGDYWAIDTNSSRAVIGPKVLGRG